MTKIKILLFSLILITVVLSSGCVYYNTFFLAKKHYKIAEKYREEAETDELPSQSASGYEKAIEKSSKVLAFYPESKWVDDALFLLGMSFLWTDEPVKAATKFEELLTAFPDSKYEQEARYWRSVAWMKAGEFEKAEAEFKALIEDGEYAEEAAFMIAMGFYEKEDYVSAQLKFEEFIENYPKSPNVSRAALMLMRIFWDWGEYDMILAQDENIKQDQLSEDDWFESRMKIGEALLELGRLEEALAHFQSMKKVKEFRDRIGDIEVRVGLIFYAQDDTAKAAQTWRDVTEDYKRSGAAAWAFYYLGEMYLDNSNYELALEMFEQASKQGIMNEAAQLALEMAEAIRNILDMQKQLAEAADSSKNPVEMRIELAEMYVLKLGQPDSAISQYRQILAENPTDPLAPKASYALGWTYAYAKQDWETADSAFAGLLQGYSESDYALGAVKYFEGRGAALDSTEVRSVGYYFIKAEELLLTNNNPQQALRYYDVVIDSFPTSSLVPKSLLAKAYIYVEFMDNSDEARAIYQSISEQYPGTEYDSLAQLRLGGGRISKPVAPDLPDSLMAEKFVKTDEKPPLPEKEEEDIERLTLYPLRPLEYNYPEQEWRVQYRGKKIRFKIFVDAFAKVKEAEIYESCGNPVIDEAMLPEIEKMEFDPEKLDVTKRNQWYIYDIRVMRPSDAEYKRGGDIRENPNN